VLANICIGLLRALIDGLSSSSTPNADAEEAAFVLADLLHADRKTDLRSTGRVLGWRDSSEFRLRR